MRPALGKALWVVRALIVALLVLVQTIPSGFALSSGNDGVELVICTADGLKLVSWEEFTGEPSPFQSPVEHEKPDCAACHSTCRVGTALQSDSEQLFHVVPRHCLNGFPIAAVAPIVHATRPPMPSRAPPANSI